VAGRVDVIRVYPITECGTNVGWMFGVSIRFLLVDRNPDAGHRFARTLLQCSMRATDGAVGM
jgi:hypothetical protein